MAGCVRAAFLAVPLRRVVDVPVVQVDVGSSSSWTRW